MKNLNTGVPLLYDKTIDVHNPNSTLESGANSKQFEQRKITDLLTFTIATRQGVAR